jgi:hypothetical protein
LGFGRDLGFRDYGFGFKLNDLGFRVNTIWYEGKLGKGYRVLVQA